MGIVRTSSTATAVIAVAVPPQAAATVVGLDLGQQPEFRLLLDLARDAGGPVVAVGTGPDGKVAIVQARPLYGAIDVPSDVASRRRSLRGYVVMFAPESARLGLAAPAPDSDLVVRVVQGQTVLASSGRGATGDASRLVGRASRHDERRELDGPGVVHRHDGIDVAVARTGRGDVVRARRRRSRRVASGRSSAPCPTRSRERRSSH